MDHAIGLFRIWVIPAEEPLEDQGLHGAYDPKREALWEAHGRKLYRMLVRKSRMLPCAEDLGTVPECSDRALRAFAIPGTDIQRWMRGADPTHSYSLPESYRPHAVASVSTHDTATLAGWWENEIGPVREKKKFWAYVNGKGRCPKRLTLQVARKTLEKVNATACIFSIQLIQDWLCLEESFRPDPAHDRINMPGLSPGENWRYRIPFPLEKLKKLKVCRTIRRLNQKTQRLA